MGPVNSPSNIDYDSDGIASSAAIEEIAPQLSLVPGELRTRSWQYLGVKRWIDVVCSTLMIIAFLIPGIGIAASVVLTSPGSVLYQEERIGRGGRPFRIWKFRSMVAKNVGLGRVAAVSQFELHSRWRTHKDIRDPRITPVGRFLRKWSLDELPQLINVLRGDMSLVGPRPVVSAELPLYEHLVGFYLAATPGLSGLWQVSGRSNVNFAQRARLDAAYVRSWSLNGDLKILIRTLPVVLGRVGAR